MSSINNRTRYADVRMKNRNESKLSVKKGKKGKDPFHVLDCKFNTIDTETVKRHIIILIVASLATKFFVIFITTSMFHSFIDLFDIGYYFEHAVKLTQGQYPYVNTSFAYPILLLVPIIIALMPALVFQNAMAFVYTFQFLMVLCDLVTIICVYLIGLRLWTEKAAFYSGLIYSTAFSAAYFVITKYDVFPTAVLMLAITFTLYGKTMKGYASAILGFFIKVFPVTALPFFILYNSKETSLKEEVIAATKIVIPVFMVLFVPVFLLSPETLKIYVPVRSELGYYSNTATFTIYSWIHDVINIRISIDTISLIMYTIMGVGILALLYTAYKIPGKNPKLLIKFLLCAIILTIVCAKVRSPQYIVWFTPLLCLLAVDDIKKIVALYTFQALAYVEFPLMFGAFYVANEYSAPVLSAGWQLTLVVFTLEYLVLFVCVWFVVNPVELYRDIHEIQT